MTNDYSEMSDEELAALRQQIDRELASRTKKPVKPASPTQPPVKTPKVPARSFDGMSAQFCRKCGHPIWETRSSANGLSYPTPLFYVKGRDDKPEQVTHCPDCKRKLSPGRLRYSEETEAALRDILKRSDDPPQPDTTMWHEYCVECGYKIGIIKSSTPPQFFDEWDRAKPVNTCPNCVTPLKEVDDVDNNDEGRAFWAKLYYDIHQMAEAIRANQRKIVQLLDTMKAKQPESLAGVNGIIGVGTSGYGTPKTSLKEQLAECRAYCQKNGIIVVRELHYSYQSSDKKLKIDNLQQEQIGVIVANMPWLTSRSHREAVEFVRQLERAGIHLEIINIEDEDKPSSRE